MGYGVDSENPIWCRWQKCHTLLCFSRFYPAYFRNRYRSRTGKDSED